MNKDQAKHYESMINKFDDYWKCSGNDTCDSCPAAEVCEAIRKMRFDVWNELRK